MPAKRKIIQIAVSTCQCAGDTQGKDLVLALANDGTLWAQDIERGGGWYGLEGVPQPTDPLKKPTSKIRDVNQIPPLRDDLDFYAEKLGLPSLEVDKFVNFYSSKLWYVGKTKMKSWKHAMANWKIRWEEKRNEGGKGHSRGRNDHGWKE